MMTTQCLGLAKLCKSRVKFSTMMRLLQAELGFRQIVGILKRSTSGDSSSIRDTKTKQNPIVFDVLESKDINAVICMLTKTFFVDEPLNQMLQITEGEGARHEELEKYYTDLMLERLSIIAVDQQSLMCAGVCINNDETVLKKKTFKDPKLQVMSDLLLLMHRDKAVQEVCRGKKCFGIAALSVNPQFRGQGLARKLLVKSEELAQNMGFQVLKSEATADFSQRAMKNLGFKTQIEIKYDEFPTIGAPMFKATSPNLSVRIVTKELKEC